MFYITTDATTDLPKDFTRENFGIIPMTYTIDNTEYGVDKILTCKEFYEKLRNGAMPTTSQINSYTAKEFLKPILEAGNDILHIAFSSGLSSTYDSLVSATNELKEEFPDRKIYLIDSKAASTGEGLLVHYALDARDNGMTVDECYNYTLSLVDKISHYFTPNDLFHLQRGGRVSKATAIAGTLLQIKPVLYCNKNGKLVAIEKVKGRKKALSALVDLMEDKMTSIEENKIIYISNADCYEDAVFVKNKIIEKFGITNIVITDIGPVIGTHAGAGTVALFFIGHDKISPNDETLK